MPLETLLEVLKTVQNRIANHRSQFSNNESATRAALIDPVLRVLGWPPDDPESVAHEYAVGKGRADYALLGKAGWSKPVCIVEAKSLDKALDPHLAQMLNYANIEGIRYACLTDGNRWRMYSVFREAPIEDRCIFKTTVTSDPVHASAIRLLALWIPNLEGEFVLPEIVEPPGPKPPPSEGISLKDLTPEHGIRSFERIRFPDGAEATVKSWNGILIETARWLDRTRDLQPKLPIVGPKNPSRVFMSMERLMTSTGKPMPMIQLERSNAYTRKGRGFGSVKISRLLLRALGESPEKTMVL